MNPNSAFKHRNKPRKVGVRMTESQACVIDQLCLIKKINFISLYTMTFPNRPYPGLRSLSYHDITRMIKVGNDLVRRD